MFVGVPLAARHARSRCALRSSSPPARPSPGTVDALGVLATQAALAIESVRLVADTERRRRERGGAGRGRPGARPLARPRQVAHLIADNVLALLRARTSRSIEVQPPDRQSRVGGVCRRGRGGLAHPLVMPPGVGACRARGGDAPRGLHPQHPERSGRHPHAELRAADRARSAIVRWSPPLAGQRRAHRRAGVAAGRGRGVDEESRQLLERIRRSGGRRAQQRAAVCRRAGARAEAETAERRVRDLVHGMDAIVTEFEIATRRVLFVNGRVETLLGYPVEQWLADPRLLALPRSSRRPRARVRLPDAEMAAGRSTGPRSTGCRPPTDGWSGCGQRQRDVPRGPRCTA